MPRSRTSQGDPALCAISKTSAGPRHAQTAAEECRGVGAFLCVVLGSDSGLTMCKTHFIKPEIPPPFLVPSAISKRLGFGMRLARIPYPSARHPYSAPCPPPLTGLARAVGGRGSPFARLLGHARHRGFISGALRSSCMSALFTVLRPSPGAYPRGGRVQCYSADREAGTPLVSWGSCAPGTQERSLSYNTSPTTPNPHHATTKAETEKQGEQNPKSIAPVQSVMTSKSDLVGSKVLYT